jgi:hypothetical protein
MGNKISAVHCNINLPCDTFTTTIGLYIHYDKMKGYYISHNEIMNIGSELDKDTYKPYKLFPNSVIKITNFDVKNSELRLLARIESKYSDMENIGHIWKDENELVNVISLYNVVPNSCLKKFNNI